MKNLKNLSNNKGFTLVELIVTLVVIIVVLAVGVVFAIIYTDCNKKIDGAITSSKQEKVDKAYADFDAFWYALSAYSEKTEGDYPHLTCSSAISLKNKLVDVLGVAYSSLPDGSNFALFSYNSDGAFFTLQVTAYDKNKTTWTATQNSLPPKVQRE